MGQASSPLPQQHILKDSCAIAEKVMQSMAYYNIAPIPDYYTLWYRYHVGTSAGLTAAIDTHIKKKGVLDDAILDQLVSEYITPPAQEDDHKAVQRTHSMLEGTLKLLGDIIHDADNHNHAIDTRLSEIIDQEDTHQIGSIVEVLLSVAEEMRSRGRDMRGSLEASRQEVEGLKQTLAEVTSEAELDFLTNVYNRKALDRHLKRLMTEARLNEKSLSLLMIDIDHFKSFNDSYGHLIGDEVLKMVSKILTRSLKGKDIVARFGGEEFAVLLPETPIGHAMTVAEHIRQTIAGKELLHRISGTSFGSVHVSIGVTMCRPHIDSMDDFIARADKALYRSKRAGRNRVTQETIEAPGSGKETITFG